MKLIKLLPIFPLLFTLSCSTPKNIDYFQDVQNGTIITTANVNDIKIQPEDKLSIVVSTQDPALSSLFNLTNNQMSPTGIASYAQGGNEASYYTVSPQGDINFPVLGLLHIAGMTRSQLASFIENKLIADELVQQPIVTVEFVNTGISVLGEVKSPGLYSFNKDHMTIVDAIAVAGDLTMNGRREDILVVRKNSQGVQEGYRVDLTNLQELANSPAYYLQQDDIIYVEPNDKTKRETTATGNSPFTPAFWTSIVSLAVTVTTLGITISRL
ncbi:MAG: polysaccharide export protein [Muribaculaceae bacterium]|nr:polysaccharide export protein [Muribaculaceae bacterium]